MKKWLAPTILVALLSVSAFADRLIKGSSPRVYVQDGGNIYGIPDAKTFECLGYQWPKIVTVPDTEISKLSLRMTLPSLEDGKLIKGSDTRVYLVTACTRRWIPDPETFEKMGLSWGAIKYHARLGPAASQGRPRVRVDSHRRRQRKQRQ